MSRGRIGARFGQAKKSQGPEQTSRRFSGSPKAVEGNLGAVVVTRLVNAKTTATMTLPGSLHDMSSWTGRTGHANLRSFTDADGNFWLEQNTAKRSKWAKFAREGHNVAWEFAPGGGYSGRMLIDGEIYTPSEAVNKFLRPTRSAG